MGLGPSERAYVRHSGPWRPGGGLVPTPRFASPGLGLRAPAVQLQGGCGSQGPLAELGAEHSSCASQGPVSFLGAGRTEAASRVSQSAGSTCQHTDPPEPEGGLSFPPGGHSTGHEGTPWATIALDTVCGHLSSVYVLTGPGSASD